MSSSPKPLANVTAQTEPIVHGKYSELIPSTNNSPLTVRIIIILLQL